MIVWSNKVVVVNWYALTTHDNLKITSRDTNKNYIYHNVIKMYVFDKSILYMC